MTITLHKHNQTKTHETWLISTETIFRCLTIERNRKRDALDTARYVINKTIGPNSGFQFLGNYRLNGNWYSEWAMK